MSSIGFRNAYLLFNETGTSESVLLCSELIPQHRSGFNLCLFSSSGSADGMGRRLHSAPGPGLSKTPTAEMEHSLHEANIVPASQVAASGTTMLDLGFVLGKELWREVNGSVGDKAETW